MKNHPLFITIACSLPLVLSCPHGPQKQKLFIYNWTYAPIGPG
jgi:hypothetical protein